MLGKSASSCAMVSSPLAPVSTGSVAVFKGAGAARNGESRRATELFPTPRPGSLAADRQVAEQRGLGVPGADRIGAST